LALYNTNEKLNVTEFDGPTLMPKSVLLMATAHIMAREKQSTLPLTVTL